VFNSVVNAINNGSLPIDNKGIYFVLTSADVSETTGFCTQYCGWHTYGTVNGVNVKFAFVGNPDACPSACEASAGNAPNGNAGADGMASIISHEADEAVSDPLLNAWYFSSGNENADQCAWTFGTTSSCNGGIANITLGSRCYLIQRNWKNTGSTSGCTMHYP
jgi:Phosphate-induced protein 1 conserved region